MSTLADVQPPLTLSFDAIHAKDISIVVGKGANLGGLARNGVRDPSGFITTRAYELFI